MGSSRSSAAGLEPYESVEITYRSFPPDLTVNLWGYGYFARSDGHGGQGHERNVPKEAARWMTKRLAG